MSSYPPLKRLPTKRATASPVRLFHIPDSPFRLHRLAGFPALFLWCLADMRFIWRGVLGGEALYRCSVFVSSDESSASESGLLQGKSPEAHSCLKETVRRVGVQEDTSNKPLGAPTHSHVPLGVRSPQEPQGGPSAAAGCCASGL